MKKLKRWLVAGALMAAVLCGGAMAAEKQINVQLDGQNLTFTDALPQVRQERTFLPFRAVFEAMGADVSWSPDAPDTVRASRKGTTVIMTLGSTEAVVEENGGRTTLTMDVAPFAENGRTYVPVRFAAQAFGCAVGWDQEAYTAILVDVDKLVEEAKVGKRFTWLEKYTAYTKQYNQGTWTVDMTADGSLTLTGMELPMKVTANGVVADARELELDMNMTVDMTTLAVLMQMDALRAGVPNGGLDSEEQALFDALKTEGVDIGLRGDLSQGKLYMNVRGEALAGSRIDSDTWYSVDMDGALAQAGMGGSFVGLLEQSKSAEGLYESISKGFLSTMTPNFVDNSGYGNSYETFVTSAKNLAEALSDEGFYADGDKMACSIDGGQNKMGLALTVKDSAVVGYEMTLFATASVGRGDEELLMEMTMTTGMDETGKMSGHVSLDVGGVMGVELDLSAGYTKGGSAPRTQPPAGATVEKFPLDR